MQSFLHNNSVPWHELGNGMRRKIVGHTPELMTVLVQFDKGAVGTPHEHDVHDQISYVVAGSFEVEVGGTKKTVRTGDTFVAPKHTRHGVVSLEAGSTLLDSFSPRRDDFLAK